MSAVSLACSGGRTRRISCTSGSMRCSIAGRRARASLRLGRKDASSRRRRWGTSRTCSRMSGSRVCPVMLRSGTFAIRRRAARCCAMRSRSSPGRARGRLRSRTTGISRTATSCASSSKPKARFSIRRPTASCSFISSRARKRAIWKARSSTRSRGCRAPTPSRCSRPAASSPRAIPTASVRSSSANSATHTRSLPRRARSISSARRRCVKSRPARFSRSKRTACA